MKHQTTFNATLRVGFLVSMLAFLYSCRNSVELTELKCFFSGTTTRFSWNLISKENNVEQKAYKIELSTKQNSFKKDDLIWDSGWKNSSQSLLVQAPDLLLNSNQTYYWRVKIKDQDDVESSWSGIAEFHTELLKKGDWNGAHWIALEEMSPDKRVAVGVTGYGDLSLNKVEERATVPMFRKSFKLKEGIESATLFVSGIGQYEASVNGEKVGDDFLTFANYLFEYLRR